MSMTRPERLERGSPCWLLKLRQMGISRLQMKGVLPFWLIRCRWSCRAGTRDFWPALAAQVGPAQNIFFLTVHFFYAFVPIAQQAGQEAMLDRLSLSLCLWSRPSMGLILYKMYSQGSIHYYGLWPVRAYSSMWVRPYVGGGCAMCMCR
jgi:hypothetical protein